MLDIIFVSAKVCQQGPSRHRVLYSSGKCLFEFNLATSLIDHQVVSVDLQGAGPLGALVLVSC